MKLEKERNQIVEYCRKLVKEGLTKGTGGNISIIDKSSNTICISSSGQDYCQMQADDIAIVDLEGNIIEGNRKPSSELTMHLLIYKNYPQANAIVHCHSVYATALSILREDLPASSYLIAACGGKDVKCANYASFGTKEIGENAVIALKDRKACLLANHGLIAFGESIEKAYSTASTLEECAQTYMIARSVGNPVILNDKEMENMVNRFKNYGR